jgi:hypothetical protein
MYPYDDPYWNVQDQKYLCKMNGYGYPLSRIREPFKYIIEQGKCSTFEAEYQEYLASQQSGSTPTEPTTPTEPDTGTV